MACRRFKPLAGMLWICEPAVRLSAHVRLATPTVNRRVGHPPGLAVNVAEASSLDAPPPPRPVGAAPAEVVGRLRRSVGGLGRRPAGATARDVPLAELSGHAGLSPRPTH